MSHSKLLEVSSVFTDILNSKKRIRVLEGGSRSSKTWSVLQWIIHYCLENRNKRISIMRAKLTWLRASVMVDFIKILQQNDLYDQRNHNKTNNIYTLFGNEIWFIGLDETQKLHGLTQDVAYINEAIEANQKDFRQIAQRTGEVIVMDYNPSVTEHWIYDSVIPRQDCDWFKSTMLDNPFLDKSLIDEIRSYEPTPENIKQGTADEFHWKVYGLGERAQAEGLIFKHWEIENFIIDPYAVKWQGIGVDFGYTNDPTAGVFVTYSNGKLYIKELFYRTRMTTADIYQELRPFQVEIVGDSAEPRLIDELQSKGLNIRGAIKGQGSILAGIDKLKQYPLIIHSDSLNLIKEFKNYKWAEDVTGKTLNKPVDTFNHAIDSLRYIVDYKTKYSEFYVI